MQIYVIMHNATGMVQSRRVIRIMIRPAAWTSQVGVLL